MKKSITLFVILFTGISITSMAQGGFQRLTAEERTKRAHDKIDSAFKLDATVMAKVDAAFTDYYKGQDKIREEMAGGGGAPDFQAMREKMQPLGEALDKKLNEALGDEKFKIWKEQIEPTMRGGRGGGGRRNQ